MKNSVGKSFGLQTMSPELKNAKIYHDWLFSKAKKYLGNNVLEIGMGDGSYTDKLLNKELIVGIDIAGDCVEYCKNKFANKKNIKCLKFDFLSDDLEVLKKFNLDSGICFNVLEHVEEDKKFLLNVGEVIEKDGYFIVIVPALQSLYGHMDKLAGHWRRYSKKDFQNLVSLGQWDIIKIEYFNSIGAIGWFMNNIFFKPRSLDNNIIGKQVRIFNKLVYFTKFFDFLTKNLFGQSLIIILRKL